MSYSAPGGAKSQFSELLYLNLGSVSVLAGHDAANPKILAKYQLVLDAGILDNFPVYDFSMIYAQGKRTVGIGSIFLGFAESDDDITYAYRRSVGFNTGAFVNRADLQPGNSSPSTTRFLAFIASNSDGATEGEIKQMKLAVEMILPPGYRLIKLV